MVLGCMTGIGRFTKSINS